MKTEQAWLNYRQKLRAFLRQRLPSAEEAEDLLQDIFVKFLQQSEKQSIENHQAWLFQVARNQLTDFYRKRAANAKDIDLAELSAKENDMDLYQQLADCVVPLLAALPEKYARALKACDLEGMKQADYAEQQGISHSAVKSQVQRGRKLLNQQLMSCCLFERNHRQQLIDFNAKPSSCQQC